MKINARCLCKVNSRSCKFINVYNCVWAFPYRPILIVPCYRHFLNLLKKRLHDSQLRSWKFLEKQVFQYLPSLTISQTLATQTSFELAMDNNVGKDSLRTTPPHHKSCQSLTHLPSPTSKALLVWNTFHHFLIAFHGATILPPHQIYLFFLLIGKWEKHVLKVPKRGVEKYTT